MKFEVHQAYEGDTFGNVVRLHRDMINEIGLKIHKIIKIKNNKTKDSIYAHLRTLNGSYNGITENKNWMRIDEDMRSKLGGPSINKEADFSIELAGKFGLLSYCINHSNPVVKYPVWITLILGIGSLIIGLLLYLFPILINWLIIWLDP